MVATTGIAFKSMLQRPVYFQFEKISNLEVIGRKVTINNGAFAYNFAIVDESDLAQVFETIQNWLSYKSNFKIDVNEYLEKIYTLKSFLREKIIPMIMEAVEKSELEQEEATEKVGACIDDINEIEQLTLRKRLNYNHAQYI